MNEMIPGPLLIVTAVTTEGACGSELAKLVTYHVLRNINRDELVTIVYCKGVTHEVGRNHRSARPGLDHRLLATLIHGGHLLVELHTDKRAFF